MSLAYNSQDSNSRVFAFAVNFEILKRESEKLNVVYFLHVLITLSGKFDFKRRETEV